MCDCESCSMESTVEIGKQVAINKTILQLQSQPQILPTN
jgi:hypothetical protein